VEQPFSELDVRAIRDVVEAVYNGTRFDGNDYGEDLDGATGEDASVLPDGINPYEAYLAWSPWVVELVGFLDGKGTQRHWKYRGAYADQPALDMAIYRIIRGRWVELRNEDMKAGR
jgi:hypothetical protein